MKYAHRYDPVKDTLPPFWHKDFFKIALERLDTSRMTAMDVALYENELIRVRTVAQFNDKRTKEAVENATKEANEATVKAKKEAEKAKKEAEKAKKEAEKAKKEAIEKAKKEAIEKATESVKKLLLRGKATIEEIAEDINVSIDFIKEIEKSL